MLNTINITENAQNYLFSLIQSQDKEDMAIRLFITQPGTPYAETCVAYCEKNSEKETDKLIQLKNFKVWIDEKSEIFLEDAIVDYIEERLGGTLTIKAPNAKLPKIKDDSSLHDKVNYYLQTDISPELASHGGFVSLVGIIEETIAVLEFGGGCQGCGMISVTLKEGIEKKLKELLPELTEIRDSTDHSIRTNAYF